MLKEIGESIGKVLRSDSHTTIEARGRYTRLCIQIVFNEPLVNTILIGHFEQAMRASKTFAFLVEGLGTKWRLALTPYARERSRWHQMRKGWLAKEYLHMKFTVVTVHSPATAWLRVRQRRRTGSMVRGWL